MSFLSDDLVFGAETSKLNTKRNPKFISSLFSSCVRRSVTVANINDAATLWRASGAYPCYRDPITGANDVD